MAKHKKGKKVVRTTSSSKLGLKKLPLPARIAFLGYLGDVQGCGTIRVMFPFMLLNHLRIPQVQIMAQYINQYIHDPNFYRGLTFVQFQRAATEAHLQIFLHFKNEIQPHAHVPLVYEIDDMLIGIPEWNFAAEYYAKNEENVKTMLNMSDAVMCSTPFLKKMYEPYNKNIHITPNHLPKFMWGDIYPAHLYKDESEKVKILWAGSQNHFSIPGVTQMRGGGDFGDKLLDFIKKTTDIYEWNLFGAMPEQLTGIKDKIRFHKWQYIFQYPRHVKALECDIGIAPLMNIPFNNSKSNIKQLEYTAMGMPGVYSAMEPYSNCELRAEDEEEMIAHIEKLAGDINYRGKIFRKEMQNVGTQLWWEENNNLKKFLETYLAAFGHKLP